jgi:hypothetical protein
MPTAESLELTEDLIAKTLSSIDDLPRELANTIANVYFKYAISTLEMVEMKKRGGMVPKSISREIGNVEELFEKYIKSQAEIQADVDAAIKFVKALREIDKQKKPNLYETSVEFILDCIKYNIAKPQKKSESARKKERKS